MNENRCQNHLCLCCLKSIVNEFQAIRRAFMIFIIKSDEETLRTLKLYRPISIIQYLLGKTVTRNCRVDENQHKLKLSNSSRPRIVHTKTVQRRTAHIIAKTTINEQFRWSFWIIFSKSIESSLCMGNWIFTKEWQKF